MTALERVRRTAARHAKRPREQVMPRINGKSFRCRCGANVFTRKGSRYTCNGCAEVYIGN
jgi:hypothetical protein